MVNQVYSYKFLQTDKVNDVRSFLLIWVLIEVLQLVVIGMLVVGYRNLQSRMDAIYRFSTHPPKSVTDD
jgi:hypothetical protein